MKKKIVLGLLIIVALFIITGCDSNSKDDKENKDNKETQEKTEVKDIEFTETVSNDEGIQYKLPKGYESNNMYIDNGIRVMFYAESYSNSVARMKEYDNYADKIEKVTINGVEYEYYKANYMKDYIIYVYRTQLAQNDYYYFEFNVFGSNYEDSHIVKFMETVEYLRYK